MVSWFEKFLIWFDIVLALALVALLNNLAGLIVSIFDPKVKASFYYFQQVWSI